MPCTACGPGFVNAAWDHVAATLSNEVRIGEALAALWNGPEDGFASIIKPSTVERIESITSGCNVGLISASRSDHTMAVNKRRWVDLYSYICPRFGSLDVDVRFSEHGALQNQTLTERCYLLLGGKDFDSYVGLVPFADICALEDHCPRVASSISRIVAEFSTGPS